MNRIDVLNGFTRESRRIYSIRQVGENLGDWWGDATTTFVKNPIDKGNYPKAAAGVAMTGLSAAVEALDYAIAGIAGKDLATPSGVPFGRLRRDFGELAKDAVGLRPVKTVANVIRLPGSALMDGAEAALGFDHGSVVGTAVDTRGKLQHTLVSDKHYDLAA